MDRLFNDLLECTPPAAPVRGTFPQVNVWEDSDSLVAEAEIPGLTMQNVEVFVLGDELTIQGKRGETSGEGVTYHRRERGLGEFSRVLRLPVAIDADKVSAELRDGVLTIRLPKAQAALPRKIQVKS
ncbi:MAG: Hsp20/alpha crystallin family protein [Planctomycetes bacterium]|nr:Hsp20/alpha crystallin family protein [Planctomycetota bacterium]